MLRKGFITAILITALMFAFAGCGSETAQENPPSVDVSVNNDLVVTDLTAHMQPLTGTKKEGNLLSSLKASVSGTPIDFTSLSYSDSTVCVGDVVYVEGIIPQADYPLDDVYAYAEDDIVSFDSANLTTQGDTSVLTIGLLGEEVGTTTVVIKLVDSEYEYFFDLEVIDSATRSMPVSDGYTVYCTPTDGKYHAYGCSYLRGNGIAISLEEAQSKGLGPCSKCQP